MESPPSHIAMPVYQPLRSALKHTSRPGTPSSSPPATSPGVRNSPFIPRSLGPPTPASPAVPLSPLPGYAAKVSFDTSEDPSATLFSYTLAAKTEGYSRQRGTRVFLCAASPDASGMQALDWALDALVQHSDELIVFRGVDSVTLEKDQESCREEAHELMRTIQEKCAEYDPDRKVSIFVEFIGGKVTDSIDRLIALYRPDSIVVGTRGQKSVIQTWGAAFGGSSVGSVSKYCLSHSPVPVIVVRPESKVRKTMAKRRADPKRGKHFDELTKTKSNTPGTTPTPGSGSGVPMSWTLTR